jgi:hypothetical protein
MYFMKLKAAGLAHFVTTLFYTALKYETSKHGSNNDSQDGPCSNQPDTPRECQPYAAVPAVQYVKERRPIVDPIGRAAVQVESS